MSLLHQYTGVIFVPPHIYILASVYRYGDYARKVESKFWPLISGLKGLNCLIKKKTCYKSNKSQRFFILNDFFIRDKKPWSMEILLFLHCPGCRLMFSKSLASIRFHFLLALLLLLHVHMNSLKISSFNLLSFLLRCSTRPHEWGTQWESNSLV